MKAINLLLESLNALQEFLKNIFGYIFSAALWVLNLIYEVFLESLSFFGSLIYQENLTMIIAVNLAFIIFWALFFILYSIQKSIKVLYLCLVLFFGVLVAFISYYLEKLFGHESIISFFTTNIPFLNSESSYVKYSLLFFISFFFVALIEEGVKFVFLKKIIASKKIDQVIDGMKAGIWLGLGFALLENLVYFIGFYNSGEFNLINITGRGFLSALAHALFGALMGYYLVLAKISNTDNLQFRMATKEGRFIGIPEESKKHSYKVAFFVPLLAHGYFNFFLFLGLGIYSLIILTISLAINLIWYGKKKNHELYFEESGVDMIFSPELAGMTESQILEDKKLTQEEKKKALLWLSQDKE